MAHSMLLESKWYVVNARSGFEQKAVVSIKENAKKQNVSNLFQDFLVPSESVSQVRRGKNITVKKKLLPSYFLVQVVMNDITWNVIKNSQFVSKLLGSSEKPYAMLESEVTRIHKLVEDGKVVKEEVSGFEVGENVKIIEGSFITFSGTIIKVNQQKKRLNINVYILSREMSVELDFNQVEKV